MRTLICSLLGLVAFIFVPSPLTFLYFFCIGLVADIIVYSRRFVDTYQANERRRAGIRAERAAAKARAAGAQAAAEIRKARHDELAALLYRRR